ncbi:2EXR domain-containing protein [Aspergillus brunneoviolaceus CBS 621.78]|uniref:Uncharacterized protein n=1 Tax=Aspergillus brunneoviolaceus CBS 621.78 TaxID=1450534 RepID=A0ACD1GN21_9EURO|nr:hypothetical protein BO95DRAFT_458996 [Aspergillus brunneoviolaceus CBS 621.78]RAH50509.1 hypothetical protein BO95DRAFT_458996 [Aspergillus brunneoviolaceus CBS 621.78]
MAFAQFSQLPPELRHYIWHLTLPDQVRPGVLFPYNEGEFSHDDYLSARMDPVSTPLPHLLVNKEANGTARSWARKLGLKIHFRPDIGTGSHVVTHHFDLDHDTLYLHATQLARFCTDPLDRRVGLPRKRMIIRDNGEGHPRIAISSMSLHLEPRALERVWWCFPRLERVYIVLNPPDLKSAEDGWEILPILYGRVEEAARKLTGSLVAAEVQRFEIRPVSVAKRRKGLSEVAR